MYNNEKVTVIMPVLNEKPTLERIIKRILKQKSVDQLLIVDDGSTDGSFEVSKRLAGRERRIRVLRNAYRKGKGFSVRKAIDSVNNGIIIIQDADEEYFPEDYPKLLSALKDDNVVYGTRVKKGQEWHTYRVARLGNSLINTTFNLLYCQNLTDMSTCYKVFRKSALNGVTLKENGFNIEQELSINFARKGYKITEVPIKYKGRTFEEGKKAKFADGFRSIFFMLKYAIKDNEN